MIKGINSSRYISVTPSSPREHINNGGQSSGEMRYNTSNQSVEVYNGNTWQTISEHITLNLTPDAESAIQWATGKMHEENELKAKMEKYPSLKSAYEQYKLVEALVYKEDKVGT
jgi:hypothetical protein